MVRYLKGIPNNCIRHRLCTYRMASFSSFRILGCCSTHIHTPLGYLISNHFFFHVRTFFKSSDYLVLLKNENFVHCVLMTISLFFFFFLHLVNNKNKEKKTTTISHLKLKELITVILTMCLLHICSG